MNDYLCLMQPGRKNNNLIIANLFIGFGDGLIIPFIVGIIALAMSQQSTSCLIYMSIAIPAVALAFGAARYFGELAEIEHHHPVLSAKEAAKEQQMMEYIGIAPELRKDMEAEMAAEKENWLQEVKDNQLGWESINKKRAFKGALHTFSALLSGGLLTLVLFSVTLRVLPEFSVKFFLYTSVPILMLSGIAGGMKAKFTGRAFLKGMVFSVTYALFSISLPAVIAWLLFAQF